MEPSERLTGFLVIPPAGDPIFTLTDMAAPTF